MNVGAVVSNGFELKALWIDLPLCNKYIYVGRVRHMCTDMHPTHLSAATKHLKTKTPK